MSSTVCLRRASCRQYLEHADPSHAKHGFAFNRHHRFGDFADHRLFMFVIEDTFDELKALVLPRNGRLSLFLTFWFYHKVEQRHAPGARRLFLRPAASSLSLFKFVHCAARKSFRSDRNWTIRIAPVGNKRASENASCVELLSQVSNCSLIDSSTGAVVINA